MSVNHRRSSFNNFKLEFKNDNTLFKKQFKTPSSIFLNFKNYFNINLLLYKLLPNKRIFKKYNIILNNLIYIHFIVIIYYEFIMHIT